MSARLTLLALEVNAVTHCNLSCVGCSHASPVAGQAFADPDIVHRDMAALAPVVDVEELRILGGEPLLHPNLPALLDAVRQSGISGVIRVITNGTRLHLTPWDWVEHADEVHVSHYPHTNVRPAALKELERRCKLHNKELVVKRYHSFRMVHPREELAPDDVQAIYDTCQDAHAWSCHTVHEGRLYMCPASAPPATAAPDESCPLEPADGLRERLERFLARPLPISACQRCLGTTGALVPHRQASKKQWHVLSKTGEIDRSHMEALRSDCWLDIGCSDDRVVVPGPARERV